MENKVLSGKLANNLVCTTGTICPNCFDKNTDRHIGTFTQKECQSDKHISNEGDK